MKRGFALFLAAILTALALTACGGSGGGGSTSSSAPAADYGAAGGGDNWKTTTQEFGFDAPAAEL